jgi:type I restriction enzyme R subunit
VETVLDQLPRAFTPELYEQKCEVVYQHVFDCYQGQGMSLYAD